MAAVMLMSIIFNDQILVWISLVFVNIQNWPGHMLDLGLTFYLLFFLEKKRKFLDFKFSCIVVKINMKYCYSMYHKDNLLYYSCRISTN